MPFGIAPARTEKGGDYNRLCTAYAVDFQSLPPEPSTRRQPEVNPQSTKGQEARYTERTAPQAGLSYTTREGDDDEAACCSPRRGGVCGHQLRRARAGQEGHGQEDGQDGKEDGQEGRQEEVREEGRQEEVRQDGQEVG